MGELNRRELLVKGTGVAATAVAAYSLRGPVSTLLSGTARAAATTAWNHDPASPIGPNHWGEIDPSFSVCGTGTNQSPINFDTERVLPSTGRHCCSATKGRSSPSRTPATWSR